MKKNIFLDFGMRGLLFTLIVTGLVQVLFYSLALPIPIWLTFLAAFAVFIVLSFYLWNLWTSILLLPATIAAVFAYVYYTFPDNWQYDLFYNIDLMVSYILGYGILEPHNMLYLSLILIVLFSLVVYVLVVLLEIFLPTFLGGLFLIGFLWYLGHYGILSYVWPFALGIILMLSDKKRLTYSEGGRQPDFGKWQLSALPVALAITLTASAIIPADTKALRWQFLEDAATEINHTIWDLFTVSGPRSGFRLWQTGFSPTTGRLGGPVTLNHEIALHVKSDIRVLLRGAVLNEYTGYSWIDTLDDRAYEFTEQNYQVKDIAFDRGEPVFRTDDRITDDQLFDREDIQINHTGIVTSVLFNANKLYDIKFDDSYLQIYYSIPGETFATREINYDESYTLDVLMPRLYSEIFHEFMNQMPVIDWSRPLSRETSDQYGLNHRKLLAIQRYYTNFPDNIPERVVDLTNDVIAHAKTPLEKALALEAFLKERFSYTLTPPYTPDDVDFVDYFLFDLRIGYCTYFATAFAVMGRIAGLPTRYIEGFLMPSQPVEGNTYEIRQSNAHAWVEVYFPGVGWLPFDPSPSIEQFFADAGYVPGVTGDFPNPFYLDPYWELIYGMWMTGPPGTGIVPSLPPQAGITEDAPAIILPSPSVLIGIVIGLLVFASLFIILLILAVQKYRQVRRDRLPYKNRMKYYLKEIIWLLSLYEYPVKKGETPYLFAQRVDTWLVNDAGSMMDVTRLLVKSEFGSHQLTEQDVDFIKRFHRNLENNVKYVMGWLKYTAITGLALARNRLDYVDDSRTL